MSFGVVAVHELMHVSPYMGCLLCDGKAVVNIGWRIFDIVPHGSEVKLIHIEVIAFIVCCLQIVLAPACK